MDITALADFLAVVREGSFSAAARARKAPVSTVSKRIQDLEARLGVRLLERTTRSLRLTSEGILLAERGARLVQDADELQRLFSDLAEAPRGLLRVCSPHLFGQMYLGPVTAGLLAIHSDLQIEIIFRDGPVDLVEDGFDCAIRLGALEPSSLMSRTFARAGNGLFASPAWLLTHGEPKAPDSIDRQQVVAYASSSGATPWLLTHIAGATASVAIEPRLRLGGMLAVRDAARAGIGIAMLPSFLAQDPVRVGALVPVLSEWSGPSVDLSLVWPASRHLSPRVRVFIDAIANRFAGGALAG